MTGSVFLVSVDAFYNMYSHVDHHTSQRWPSQTSLHWYLHSSSSVTWFHITIILCAYVDTVFVTGIRREWMVDNTGCLIRLCRKWGNSVTVEECDTLQTTMNSRFLNQNSLLLIKQEHEILISSISLNVQRPFSTSSFQI